MLSVALIALTLGLITLGCRRTYRHLCRVRLLAALAACSDPVNAGPFIQLGIKIDRVEVVANPDGTYTTTLHGHAEEPE